MQRTLFLIAVVVMSLALACGGGGGGAPTPSGTLTLSPSPTGTITPTPTPTPTGTPPLGTAAYVSGKVVSYPTGNAIAGATVKNAANTVLATTNASGDFTATLYPGAVSLTIRATGVAPYSLTYTIDAGMTYNAGTIYLRNATTSTATTTATGATINVGAFAQVVIPGGFFPNGTSVSVSYIPAETLDVAMPGRFPTNLGMLGGVVIDAPTVNMKLDRAVDAMQIKLSNTKSIPAGTRVPIGALEKGSPNWKDATVGQVSNDGQWIECETNLQGEIAAGLPAESADAKSRGVFEVSTSEGNFIKGEPNVDITTGNLRLGVDLPAIYAFGIENFLTFIYETDTIRPNRFLELIVKERPTGDAAAECSKIIFGAFGTMHEAMLNDTDDPILARARVPVTKQNAAGKDELLPSGPYPYGIKFDQYFEGTLATSENDSFTQPKPGVSLSIDSGVVAFDSTGIKTDTEGKPVDETFSEDDPFYTFSNRFVALHNESNSPFGKGWYLAGLERLYFNEDKTAAALIGRRDGRPIVFRPEGIPYSENYRYLVHPEAADITDPYATNPTHVVAVDGDYIYVAYSQRTGYSDPATVYIYKMKDPLLAEGTGAYPDEPIGGEDKTYITSVDLVNPDGDAIAVNPVTHELYLSQAGNVRKWTGMGWENVCDIGLIEVGYPIIGNIRFDANGNLYILGFRQVFRVLAGTTTPESIFWVPNRVAGLGVAADGTFYTADEYGHILYRGWRENDTDMQETVVNAYGTDVLPGDRMPLSESEFGSIKDIELDRSGNIYLMTDRAIYKVGADMYIELYSVSTASNLPEEMQLNKERVKADKAGYFDARYMTLGKYGCLYLGGVGAKNSLRIWLMTRGVWKTTGSDVYELTFENDKYVRSGDNAETYEYDLDGFLTAVKFPHGRNISITYITPQGGSKRISQYAIDGIGYWDFVFSGGMITVTDSAFRVTRLLVDASGTLSSIETPGNVTSTYQYNADGFMIRRNLPDIYAPTGNYHNTIEYTYDPEYNLTEVKYNGGYKQTITPDGISSTINELAGQGTWPSLAPPVTSVQAKIEGDNEPVVNFKRQGLTFEVEQNDRSIKKDYDEQGRVTRIENPDGSVILYEWTELASKPKKVTNIVRGDTWIAEFNVNGHLERVTNPINEWRYFVYGDNDRVSEVWDGNTGKRLVFNYASSGLPSKQTRDGKTEFEAQYDTHGRITSLKKFGVETTYTYNNYGQVTKTVTGSEQVDYEYSASGHLNSMTSGSAEVSMIVSGQHSCSLIGGYVPGFVVAQVDRGTGIINFKYDYLFNPVDMNSPEGTYEIEFSENGLPKKMTYPDLGNVIFQYDASGKCTQKLFYSPTNGNRVLNFTYNTFGFMTNASANTSSISMLYNEEGNLSQISYAPIGLDHDVLTWNLTVNSTNGRLNSLQHSTGSGNIYYFDYSGFEMAVNKVRMYIASSGTNADVAMINRNTRNQITEVSFSDYLVHYQRDDQGRITRTNGYATFNLDYTYDALGCTSYASAWGNHTVTNDAAGRVTGVAHPVGFSTSNESYTYDSNNNRTYSHLRGSALYSGSGLTTGDLLVSDVLFTYSYDTNGRMVSQNPRDGSNVMRTFKYDAEGNLTEVQIYNGQAASSGVAKTIKYAYNALGMRVSRDDGTDKSYFFYDANKRLTAYRKNNMSSAYEFIHLDDMNRPIGMYYEGKLYTFTQDAFRNIIAVRDGATQVDYYAYDTYGNLVYQEITIGSILRYAAAEFDEDTGMYYMRHRWYDPMLGRFITPDPNLFKSGYNLYTYAKGNPYRYFDPEGKEDEEYEEEWDGQIEFNDPYDYEPSGDNAGGTSEIGGPTPQEKAQNLNTQEHINDSVSKAGEMAGEQAVQEGVKRGIKYGVEKYGEKLLTHAPKLMKFGGRAVPFLNIALIGKDILDVAAYAYGQYEYYRIAP